MNYKKKLFFLTVFLLSTISFSSWAQPYVRIEELDQDVNVQNFPNYVDASYYYNPTVKLYADAECTIPYTTTTDLDVTVETCWYDGEYSRISGNVEDDVTTESYTVTIPSGNSSYSLYGYSGRLSVYQIYYNYSYYNYWNDDYIEFINSSTTSYSVLPGNGYESLPSVVRPYQDIYEFGSNWQSFMHYRVYEPSN